MQILIANFSVSFYDKILTLFTRIFAQVLLEFWLGGIVLLEIGSRLNDSFRRSCLLLFKILSFRVCLGCFHFGLAYNFDWLDLPFGPAKVSASLLNACFKENLYPVLFLILIWCHTGIRRLIWGNIIEILAPLFIFVIIGDNCGKVLLIIIITVILILESW